MIIFQWLAQGESVNGFAFSLKSKKVYKTKKAAAAGKDEFETSCRDQRHFNYVEAGSPIKFTLVELELIDDE
jgi:hypothetical protein